VNGEYASQNRRLLCDILREEWGFDGLVVSDWGATVDRVQALAAGLDLEMPYLNGVRDARIVAAVESGALPMGDLDAAATRVTELILRAEARQPMHYAAEEHRALACRAATQSAVLLKNINNILPGNAQQCAAVIGAFAKQPRYQGTGSSKIVPLQLDNAFDTLAGLGLKAEYAPGYRIDSDAPDAMLVEEACRVARDKEIVYIFAGLPDSYEAETFDRENLAMPQNHVELIEAVCQVNDRVVVVLQGGSPMELPWEERVQGILMMYLGGEASGCACAELLLGLQNPSGKLAESWPLVLEDTPAYGNFPGYPLTVEYREGIFVGYRYYDSAAKAVRYPFGYGLSYTQFTYGDLRLSAQHIRDDEPFVVTCRVTNSGTVAGAEIAQLYVAMPDSAILRAAQELKGFEKVFLKPGESREINFTLEQRDFAYYNTAIADWHVESGTYQIRVGASSRDIRLTGQVVVQSTRDAPLPDVHALAPGYYDLSQGVRISDAEFRALLGREIPARAREKGALHSITSTMTDIQDRWFGRQLWALLNRQLEEMVFDSSDVKMMARKMMPDMPLYFLQMKGGITLDQIEGIVDILNGRLIRGVRKLVQKNGKRLD